MATIRDISNAVEQVQQMQAQIEKALAFGAIDPMETIAKATGGMDAFRKVISSHDEKLAQAMRQMANPMETPAFVASRKLAAMFDTLAPKHDFSALLGKLNFDFSRLLVPDHVTKALQGFSVDAHFAKLYEISAITESALRVMNYDQIGQNLGLDAAARTALLESQVEFGSGYQALFVSDDGVEPAVVTLPSELSELPAVEYLNQASLIASSAEVEFDPELQDVKDHVQKAYAEDASDELVELLESLDPGLIIMLQGARAVLATQHPDYVRHFAASLRELFTHVLHKLAPDDAIKTWSTDGSDFDKGRPTRRARMRYITHDFEAEFGGFLKVDIDAGLQFITAFQQGTHAIESGFTPQKVNDLKVRMEALIRLLLLAKKVR